MAVLDNEGKCCDAVLRRIEAELGVGRQNVRKPEALGDPAPIDLACEIGGQLFAFEHTRIEPFVGFIQMNQEASWRVAPIQHAISDRVPAGEIWQLMLPLGALDNLRGDQLRRAQGAIVEWILSTAAILPLTSYSSYPRPLIWTRLPNVPFEVRLDRWRSLIGRSYLQICHLAEAAKSEPSRTARLLRLREKKLPNLRDWGLRGARTVLILEDNDMFSTNEALVFDTLKAVRHEFEFWPDQIYMVGTFLDEYWPIWLLWDGARDYYSLEDSDQCRTVSCDPKALDDAPAGIASVRSSRRV